MARNEHWFDQDLNHLVKVRKLNGNVFMDDNHANAFGVNVYKNGKIVDLSGTVKGYCVLPDGRTISANGSCSGNRAWVAIPNSVYSIPGTINISIKLIDGTETTTLLCVSVNNKG